MIDKIRKYKIEEFSNRDIIDQNNKYADNKIELKLSVLQFYCNLWYNSVVEQVLMQRKVGIHYI